MRGNNPGKSRHVKLPGMVAFREYVERLCDSSQLGVDGSGGDVPDAAKAHS